MTLAAAETAEAVESLHSTTPGGKRYTQLWDRSDKGRRR